MVSAQLRQHCVSSRKFPHLSEPGFPHLENLGDSSWHSREAGGAVWHRPAVSGLLGAAEPAGEPAWCPPDTERVL